MFLYSHPSRHNHISGRIQTMHRETAIPTTPTRPSVWDRVRNKRWPLIRTKSKLSLDDGSARPKPGGLKRMLSSRLGTSVKTSRPWSSSIWARGTIHGEPEEAVLLTRPRVFLQRTTSVTTVDRIRPPSHYVDYSRVPLACDRRGSTQKSSIVAQASEGVTLATLYSDDGEPLGREFDRRRSSKSVLRSCAPLRKL